LRQVLEAVSPSIVLDHDSGLGVEARTTQTPTTAVKAVISGYERLLITKAPRFSL
jgi:hypothetical protein